jgi:8-oxo-dGTP diphosphatase
MMRDATLCLLFRGTPVKEVLLGKKKARFGAGKYNGFGGKVEPDETIVQAAVRELAEEAGVQVALNELHLVAHLTFLFPHRREWEQIVYVYCAHTWQGTPVESEEMVPSWFGVDEIPYDEMWDDDRFWLPHVLAGKRVQATFTYRADNETVEHFEIQEWNTERHGDEHRDTQRSNRDSQRRRARC